MAILRVKDSNGNWIEIPAIVGPKPVAGVDYWTDDEKAQMVSDVIAALPVYNGEAVNE